jgi:hypothetical protein
VLGVHAKDSLNVGIFRGSAQQVLLPSMAVFLGRAMNHTQSSCRTDDQLEDIVCETGHWIVNGQAGRVLCFASSHERAATYGASGTGGHDAVSASLR